MTKSMLTPTARSRRFLLGVAGWLCLNAACTRTEYREAADADVRQLVAEKSTDPRWALEDFGIDLDPQSRYFDPHDPDHPPMPPDDPASHELMSRVYGKKGSDRWHEYGTLERLENPSWRRVLEAGLPRTSDGKFLLSLEDAIRLSLRHSPNFQGVLETLYLSALDVSTERFRFDVQFFGGFDSEAEHVGSENFGGERNTLSASPTASIRKGFATAGELLVGFANTIGIELLGPNDGFAMSQLSFSLVQPLLRGGGRVVGAAN